MFCVGLTGNIASGKSTVAGYFANLGIDIISADKIARELTTELQPAFQGIVKHFGDHVLTPTGQLDRRSLRQLIFTNPTERLWLENYLHPLIRKQIELQIPTMQSPYCIIEIPLLRDRTRYPYLNRVLVIVAEAEQQIARLTVRDHCSKEDTLAILATQTNQQILCALADDRITNTGSLGNLEKDVEHLHKKYLQYAKKYPGYILSPPK